MDSSKFARDSLPLGRSWQDWIQLWWMWCYGDGKNTSPVSDTTGEHCDKGQIYDRVWFLAGTFGGSVKRKCVVPSDRSLFFPVLNDIISFATDPHLKTEEDLASYAKADLDKTRLLRVSIDEIQLLDIREYRFRTAAFDLTVPILKPAVGNESTRAVSDGYWLFLHPLTKGLHRIHFVGEKLEIDRLISSDVSELEVPIFRVEVTYDLTVR